MRLHTEHTIEHLSEVMKEFGKVIRKFREDVCLSYNTVETPSELSRRERNQARQKAPGVPQETHQQDVSRGRRPKLLNLETYKFHSLGDYPTYIRLFGPTDSFSTQPGELAHRLVKRLYGITNKREVAQQIGNHVRRRERAELAQKVRLKQTQLRNVGHRKSIRASKTNDVEDNRELHWYASANQNSPVDVARLVRSNHGNPAYKNFVPKLKDHLLGRRSGRCFDGDEHSDFTDDDRNTVQIYGNTIYEVGTCQINFTTYDNRRDYDTINPKTHPDVMVLSQDDQRDAQPFWYGRVLVGFVEHFDDFENYAFGFLDPAQDLRGSHLIPVFRLGKTHELLPFDCPVARQVEESKSEDWVNYYVNIFVDRDMVMRHYGGGVGHLEQIRRQFELEGDVSDDENEESEPQLDATGVVIAGIETPNLQSPTSSAPADEDDRVTDDEEDAQSSDVGTDSEDGESEREEETDDDDDGRYASD
ncbi:hypothetical protein EST38_g10576 [Candolleomyces aberdarensis]|uniref:Uncharacterized protein n=1 Tax=Candolleomyces aberdarensis TaxID=2316362 RepID=A0A4V1Q2J2_9AGAR|nr:hypothetical protein EST38_g10576 [Candolleomyces aberdarensis]